MLSGRRSASSGFGTSSATSRCRSSAGTAPPPGTRRSAAPSKAGTCRATPLISPCRRSRASGSAASIRPAKRSGPRAASAATRAARATATRAARRRGGSAGRLAGHRHPSAVAHPRPGAADGPPGDVAPLRDLDALAAVAQLAAAEQGAEDDLQLQHREAGAEAAAAAAAEGDPAVGAGGGVEEALGTEGVGLGVDLRVVMDEVGVGDEGTAGLVGPVAYRYLLGDEPGRDVGQDRAVAEGLADRCRQVGIVLAGVDLGDEAVEHGPLADELLEGPGEGGGGGLVAGDQQRHQLVADLLLAHRRTVLVARFEQDREEVDAVAALGPALGNQAEDDLVDFLLDAQEAGEGTDSFGGLGDPALRLRRQQANRFVTELEHLAESRAEGVEAGAWIEAEDGAEADHHERRRRRQADREAFSVTVPAALEEGEGSSPEAGHLQRRRHRRPGGKGGT